MPESIYAIYANKYRNMTPGEALFFHSSLHGAMKGLRVILPDKRMEFSDTSFIGADPSGFFYYDDFDEAKTADNYTSDLTTNPKDGQKIAWVKFYHGKTLVAEFIGDDYFNVVQVAGMVGYSAQGQWKISSATSVDARLQKDANSTHIILDVSEAIKMKATMTTNDPTLTASCLSNIGLFCYYKMEDIKEGVYVSYTNDRLVFYRENGSSTEFTGSFIPSGRRDSPMILGIVGDAELTLSGTKWDHN